MVNSTTPRFEERCPGFFETASTMNSRISAASFGRPASFSFFKSSGYSTESNNLLMFHYLLKPKNYLFQVIPFKSPLAKGDSGGCVFSGLFYNPLAPFSKGDSLCHTSYNPHK